MRIKTRNNVKIAEVLGRSLYQKDQAARTQRNAS
ncbi:hypothetical protein LSS_11465 [Leptospira santarosai serovar Shermani str. LT 821]|uniref:Uncharacterized protein n=1 Tax=Leptospira santarosai serovar Shermani str. LT 821 TaxID=758847 RepID=K8XZ82_9LEPT|nr:hypothetical protein LSS_11465 [Leptospira santarosai serovar Shermani str. LT 821]